MSGRKNIIPAYRIVTAGSLTDDFSTTPVTFTTSTHLGFTVSTTGVTNNSGTFGAEYKIYKDLNYSSDWIPLTLSSTPTLADADGQFFVDLTLTPGQVRLTFTAAGTSTAEVQLLTFPAKAASTDGDYIVIYDEAGTAWAVALDKTGAASNPPTGAIWTAIPSSHKVYKDISGGSTAATVAALAKTALNALVGFTAVITLDDSAANGTMSATQVVAGPTTNPSPHNKNDSGVGSITGSVTTPGVLPDGVCDIWVTGDQEG